MRLEDALELKLLGTVAAVVHPDVTDAVNVPQMHSDRTRLSILLAANMTRIQSHLPDAVCSAHVLTQAAGLDELPVANHARVLGVGVFRSSTQVHFHVTRMCLAEVSALR